MSAGPGPQIICMPTLLGAAPVSLLGYPLEMVLAQKTVTALERGTVNTRWRDFADMWTPSRRGSLIVGLAATVPA